MRKWIAISLMGLAIGGCLTSQGNRANLAGRSDDSVTQQEAVANTGTSTHVPTSQPGSSNASASNQRGTINTNITLQDGGILAALLLSVVSYPIQRRLRLGKQKAGEMAQKP